MGVKVLHQYALLGSWDFLNVLEAPDELTMMRVASKAAEHQYFDRRLLFYPRPVRHPRSARIPALTRGSALGPTSRPAFR